MSDFTEVYRPDTQHRCAPKATPFDWMRRGGVIQCDECGRYWRRGRVLFTDGYHLEWKPVRWWNFLARRRISESLS